MYRVGFNCLKIPYWNS